ncbi:hypothetical protein, partial [Pseudomonas viridiflava]|uniref:hypothetical protein n=1 Tax=Pseudomonas viridiflava TaxID=33069 RepID=UPI001CA8B0DA
VLEPTRIRLPQKNHKISVSTVDFRKFTFPVERVGPAFLSLISLSADPDIPTFAATAYRVGRLKITPDIPV